MTKDNIPHKCIKCGKIIKPGEEYTHQGQIFCCSRCCKRTDTPKNVCEFC